jgi:phospholipid:diacylglycerol acyltransferase
VDFLKHKAHVGPRQNWKDWLFGRKFFFPAGVLAGLMLAVALTPLRQIPPEILDSLSGREGAEGFGSSALSTISTMFSGMSLPGWQDLEELTSNMTFVETAKKALTNRDFRVGTSLLSDGYKKKHPMILVPGIVSTGLESWATSEDAKAFFRKRLWGTTTMIQAVLSDKNRWVAALSLDPVTGLDPPGYKVRAAQGLDAASEFIQGGDEERKRRGRS